MSDSTLNPFDSQLPLKKCSDCKEYFPPTTEYWYRNKTKKDGLQGQCKVCLEIRKAKWDSENPGKQRQAEKNWRLAHPDREKERDDRRKPQKAAYYQKKRARMGLGHSLRSLRLHKLSKEEKRNKAREQSRLYRNNNIEQEKNRLERWRLENPDRIKEHRRNRRARKKGAEGSYTEAEVRELYIQQNGLCFHCGCDLEETGFDRDHWIPLGRPGTSNYIENIRLLCPVCNRSKGNKYPWEWSEKYSKP